MAADPVSLVRDPNLAKNRIFIGNLPTCTREELESICHPYGNVLGSLVHKNFGFVQFETEEMANKVASALTKSTFKGNVITVRNAGFKPAPKRPAPDKAEQSPNTECNDCEIIVVNRDNTKYAEYIEERLKRLNLRVDVLFPNEDVSLSKVLANIASRGCLYAVLVTQQHQEHNSITVNILTGNAAEHRNMPVEDAIKLIGEDFRAKMPANKMPRMSIQSMQKPAHVMAPIVNPAVGIALPYAEPLPDFIQNLANLLTRNLHMTVLQHDKLIKFLQERRERQMRAELGDDPAPKTRDPEIELQKKILDILQKPSVAETHHQLYYPNLDAVKEDHELVELLKDERIRRALDQLIDSPVADYVTKFLKM